MRIAIPYENGQVFQHFGKTQSFKLYDVQEGQIAASAVVGTNGQGHGMLSALLAMYHVDLVICGGIGPGAQMALNDVEIRLIAGIQGQADAAVTAYLAGTLISTGATCNHHEGGCGHHGEDCGHHEGGCHGCH